MKTRKHRVSALLIVIINACFIVGNLLSQQVTMQDLETQFQELPIESRRLVGPLFWLHGDESPERLQMYLEKVAEGGNGCFTAESRPHDDWLGPGWYRDLAVCLEAAKKNDLQMWIFDERWWPSGSVGGHAIPVEYINKLIEAVAWETTGGIDFQSQYSECNTAIRSDKLIAVLAGKIKSGGIDGDSIIDLTDKIVDGMFTWSVPTGTWKVMAFTWKPNTDRHLVDGASQDAVDWFIEKVYQPHYDHFSEEYGKTIQGYFYDEPETWGDWGKELIPFFKQRGVDWKKVLVAWKYNLAGDEHVAARYQYSYGLAEVWGKTLYGGLTDWCHKHNVKSIGHFLEHKGEYLSPRMCGGDIFQLQKYSEMGAIDAVWYQFAMGKRVAQDNPTWQTPRIASSVSHVYGKKDDLAMVEIFGARQQDLTYPEMKWWTDHMLVSGINFFIPHSFNPRAPFDTDCPPYFYNGGYEPRWPLYRVYADYTARMSLMLSGGNHVCPIAFLFLGQSKHVGESVMPEHLSSAIQDSLYDCDWMPYDVFEQDVKISGKDLELYKEKYKVLIVPPVEVIPWETLSKVDEFFQQGGIVVGYGFLPSMSATFGHDSSDIATLRKAIWAETNTPSFNVCKTNDAGGRSYLLPEEPTAQQLKEVLAQDAGIAPVLDVIEGDTRNWLHVLHRQKVGSDIFFICNQNDKVPAQKFKFRAFVKGIPECWDPLRNEITSIPYEEVKGKGVDFSLTLEPLESVLIIFSEKKNKRPSRIDESTKSVHDPVALIRSKSPPVDNMMPDSSDKYLKDAAWIWYPEKDAAKVASIGTRFFRKLVSIPQKADVTSVKMFITADNEFSVKLNGRHVGGGWEWQKIHKINLTKYIEEGNSLLAIEARNMGKNPDSAGVIGYVMLEYKNADPVIVHIDKSWKASDKLQPGWAAVDFDDSGWSQSHEVAKFGGEPWVKTAKPVTLSPIKKADPFYGSCEIPPSLNLDKIRIYLELESVTPEEAASVTVNDQYAGGFIGKPLRLNVTEFVQKGCNNFIIEPFAPKAARLVFYSK